MPRSPRWGGGPETRTAEFRAERPLGTNLPPGHFVTGRHRHMAENERGELLGPLVGDVVAAV
jgi:hypothetical protein